MELAEQIMEDRADTQQRPLFLVGSAESQAVAEEVVEALDVVSRVLADHAEELGRLDAVTGDGDHGIAMERGATAAAQAVHALQGAGLGSTLRVAGDAWAYGDRGTSGSLWGIALRSLGETIGDEAEPAAEAVAEAMADARDAIQEFGEEKVGVRAMLSVLGPVVEAAREGRWADIPAIAERAAGMDDAEAVSLALVIRTVMEA